MTAITSEVTLFAVERFWLHIRCAEREVSIHVETALHKIASNPGDVSSRAWCALLLHATFVDTSMVCDVLASLGEKSSPGRPPTPLLNSVGFAHWRGDDAAVDASMEIQFDLTATLRRLRNIPALNNQSVAEILLALAGTKVSRLTAPASDIRLISQALDYPVFIAGRSLVPIADLTLCGFSNQSSDGGLVSDLAGKREVYAYFGGDLADRAVLSVLDRLNAGGSYLGIPACCRSFFSATWEPCLEQHSGDLAFTLISSHPEWSSGRPLQIPWQCNPYGMYGGGGLLWHFPCSLWCQHTIDLVDARYRLLERLDSEFATETRCFQERVFKLFPDRRFQFEIGGQGGVIVRPTSRVSMAVG